MSTTRSRLFEQADTSTYVAAMADVADEVFRDLTHLSLRPVSVDVGWHHGEQRFNATVHFTGQDTASVDTLSEFYGLPRESDDASSNYTREGKVELGNDRTVTARVFCGRPKDRMTLIREWVAANYSDESKRLVAEGAEATPEDQAKFVPVQHGTAEQLARIHHFRQLTGTLPDAHELDPVLRFLIGRVTDTREVLEHLHDELDQLWSLITEDFDDDQLDELTEADWMRHSFATQQQELDHRHSATVARLVRDIEGHIGLHRIVHAENTRPVRTGAAA